LYRALATGSHEELSALLDQDVQWHVPGAHPRSGTYSGRAQTLALIGGRKPDAGFEILDVLTGGRFVMVFVQHEVRRYGVTETWRFVHVMQMRAGRVAESWHFDENQTQLDEFLNEAHRR
jgi:ketosteroid isomerase-like protein